jgi:hypothetical protein
LFMVGDWCEVLYKNFVSPQIHGRPSSDVMILKN